MRNELKRKSFSETPWIQPKMSLLLLSPTAAAIRIYGDTHSIEDVLNDNTIYPE